MTHIFIAYSHQNIEFARQIETDLRANGYEVWRDESAGVLGNDWKCKVTQALDRASTMIVIVSANSVESENVDFEVEYALRKGIPIVGIQCENSDIIPALEHMRLIDDAIEFISVDECSMDQQSYSETLLRLILTIEQSQGIMATLKFMQDEACYRWQLDDWYSENRLNAPHESLIVRAN